MSTHDDDSKIPLHRVLLLLMLLMCHVRLLSLTVLVKALMIADNCNNNIGFTFDVVLSLYVVKTLILALK